MGRVGKGRSVKDDGWLWYNGDKKEGGNVSLRQKREEDIGSAGTKDEEETGQDKTGQDRT